MCDMCMCVCVYVCVTVVLFHTLCDVLHLDLFLAILSSHETQPVLALQALPSAIRRDSEERGEIWVSPITNSTPKSRKFVTLTLSFSFSQLLESA